MLKFLLILSLLKNCDLQISPFWLSCHLPVRPVRLGTLALWRIAPDDTEEVEMQVPAK